jgi:hypothetical protein
MRCRRANGICWTATRIRSCGTSSSPPWSIPVVSGEPVHLACEQAGWRVRRDCQFHWTNHGYASFDAYLKTFTAEKRKKAKRERFVMGENV